MAHGRERFKPKRVNTKSPQLSKQAPQQPQINVPLNSLDDIVCGKCSSPLFIQVFAIKHLPALYNPTGKEGTVNAISGVMCTECGAINNVIRQKPGGSNDKSNKEIGEKKE